MGNLFGSQPAVQNEAECDTPYYYFPPRFASKFFASTFLIGGEKFEMSAPESYLFGDNFDLNYLGGKPARFPYNNSPSTMGQPITQMIRALINIRKETLKLFTTNTSPSTPPEDMQYFIEFVYDSDVDFSITIYFICHESTTEGLKYFVRNDKTRSETFHYKAGTGQIFSESSPVFNPNNYHATQLIYQILDEKGEFNPEVPYPVVIHCVSDEGPEPRQSHSLIGTIEKIYDNAFSLKPLKQKIFIDGLAYLLQEIYGIENKANKTDKAFDEDSNHSYECVICMSELRDTLILPCRHLCLCKHCANSLRYQANNCPICRVPFRALLQIKALQFTYLDGHPEDCVNIPHGYQQVALVEALNGPTNIGPNTIFPGTTAVNSNKTRSNISIPIEEPAGSRPQSGLSIRSRLANKKEEDPETITTFEQIEESEFDKQESKLYGYGAAKASVETDEQSSSEIGRSDHDSTSASSSSSSSTSSFAQRTRLLNSTQTGKNPSSESDSSNETGTSHQNNDHTHRSHGGDNDRLTDISLPTDSSVDNS